MVLSRGWSPRVTRIYASGSLQVTAGSFCLKNTLSGLLWEGAAAGSWGCLHRLHSPEMFSLGWKPTSMEPLCTSAGNVKWDSR